MRNFLIGNGPLVVGALLLVEAGVWWVFYGSIGGRRRPWSYAWPW